MLCALGGRAGSAGGGCIHTQDAEDVHGCWYGLLAQKSAFAFSTVEVLVSNRLALVQSTVQGAKAECIGSC